MKLETYEKALELATAEMVSGLKSAKHDASVLGSMHYLSQVGRRFRLVEKLTAYLSTQYFTDYYPRD